ncbi:MAG: hypothetical protein ACK2T3_12870, partial [Candidatus Promineifilaceae bacterium]
MAKNATTSNGDTEELRNRVDWLDEERLKTARRLAELEQRLTSWERDLKNREKRLQELEVRLSKASGQIARVTQNDEQLSLFRNEMIKLVEQNDQRRVLGDEELEKRRNIEHEVQQREVADIRKTIAVIDRLVEQMEHRKAEEERLSKLIGQVQNRERALAGEVENWQQGLKFVRESEQNNATAIAEFQTSVLEVSQKIDALTTRLDVTNHTVTRVQAAAQEMAGTDAELRQQMKSFGDQVQMGELQRNKRLGEWQATLDSTKGQMDAYAAEWVKFATQ